MRVWHEKISSLQTIVDNTVTESDGYYKIKKKKHNLRKQNDINNFDYYFNQG